jgi:hypothetical protein
MKTASRFRFLATISVCAAISMAVAKPLAAGGSYSFQPITPCRVVDTRTGLGGYRGLLPNGLPGIKFTLKGAAPCNLPVDAAAVVVNMTVADTGSAGWVALFPGNAAWPGVSSLNFLSGGFLANGAVVPLSAGAQDLSVLAAFATAPPGANLILDITGYFTPLAGQSFYPITPCRIVDTQTGLGGFSGPLPNGLPGVKFTIKGAAPCNIPVDAAAIAVNATVVNPANQGWVALFPANAAWPGVSLVDFFANDTTANGAIVPVSPGSPDLMVLAAFAAGPSGANIQLDLTGYFK